MTMTMSERSKITSLLGDEAEGLLSYSAKRIPKSVLGTQSRIREAQCQCGNHRAHAGRARCGDEGHTRDSGERERQWRQLRAVLQHAHAAGEREQEPCGERAHRGNHDGDARESMSPTYAPR